MTPKQLYENNVNIANKTVHIMFPNIKKAAKKNRIDPEDIFHYAYESLWKSCLSFDESKGRTFPNYAITNIRRELPEKLRRDCKKFSCRGTNINPKDIESTEIISMDAKTSIDGDEGSTNHELIASNFNLESNVLDKIINEKILDFIPPRTLEFIKLKADGVTIREIGRRYGISHQAVNIHINKVIKKVKRSGYIYAVN